MRLYISGIFSSLKIKKIILNFTNLTIKKLKFLTNKKFRASDPIATINCIVDAHLSTRQLAQTTLRNILGTRTLTEIMLDREGIARQAQEVLDEGKTFKLAMYV